MILRADANMSIKELMKIYPVWVAITAIILFIMHLTNLAENSPTSKVVG